MAAIDGSVIVNAFNGMGGDSSRAVRASSSYSSIGTWKAAQASQTAAAGAAAAAVPGAHLVGLVADVAFLLHKMAYCSWGVGGLMGCTVEGKDDFALILRVWSGDLKETELPVAILTATPTGLIATSVALQGGTKTAAKLAGKLTSKGVNVAISQLGSKVATKALAKGAGGLAGAAAGHLASQAATKIAAKVSAKVAAKGLAGFVPLVGPVVSGGVNAYFTNDIAKSAETYYRNKRELLVS